MQMYYSAATRGFYDELSSNIPADAREVPDDIYYDLINVHQPAGKRIVPDADGNPIAVDPPPITPENQLARDVSERDECLRKAALRIAPLQDAVDLGIASADDIALLKLWKQYRVALGRLDLTVTPISWPVAPGTL